MRGIKWIRRRKGAIAIETALAMPLFLVLAAMILQYGVQIHSLLLLRHAAENAAQETALLMTVVEASGVDGLLERLLIEQTGESQITGKLYEMTTRLGYEAFFESRMSYWMASIRDDMYAGQGLSDVHALLESNLSEDELYVRVTYNWALLAGQTTGSFEVYIPFFAGNPLENGPSSTTGAVWSLDNFTRGRVLRQRNGGNLPINYPVIAAYRDGAATAIRSLDHTAPTWQNEGAIYSSLRAEIDALARFDGTAAPWGQERIDIHAGMIHTRVMLVIVPENSRSEIVENQLSQAVAYAQSIGVHMSVLTQGQSVRYAP